VIRPQRDDESQAVRQLVTAAFGDTGRVGNLTEALRARTDTRASLVAIEDDEPVGFTHLSISWVDAPTRLLEVLTLSPLAVAPEHQSRGIGTRLLDEAMKTADSLGAPLVFLEGNPAYYGPRGWLPAADLGFAPPSTRVPMPGFQVRTLKTYDPTWMVGALVYNDTFWAHDCVGLRP
jgi:putative acetyltransferase